MWKCNACGSSNIGCNDCLLAEREAHEKTKLDLKNACDVGRRIDIKLTKQYQEADRLRVALQAIKYIYDEILSVRLPISGEHPMGIIARDALAGLEIVTGEPTATPSRSPSDSRDTGVETKAKSR